MKVIGKEIRLGRLLGNDSNVIITAVDHGTQMGAIKGLIDLPSVIEVISSSDGILINPEILGHFQHIFAKKEAPALLMRVTWTTGYCFEWNYDQGHSTQVMPVEDALKYGADVVTASCILQTGDQSVDRQNVKLFSKVSKAANDFGIPLMGEAYPLGADFMEQKELHRKIAASVRILWELGADVIKTFYTGPDFGEIVQSVKAPIVVLGAIKKPTELAALQMVEDAVNSGGRGVAFGRNVFQTADPKVFIEALKEVVNKRSTALEAVSKFGLK